MRLFHRSIALYFLTVAVIAVTGQQKCEDYSPDPSDCTRFFRCFHNLRIKFLCPPGTAWEDSLKTCVWKEYVEACGQECPPPEKRSLDEEEIETYEADPNALAEIPVGHTLAEAKALGPMVTPKQYQCSYCSVGVCGVMVATVQCYCGTAQCPPTAQPQPRNPCDQNPCLNGGQCMSNGQGFICRCPSTYTGNRCEAPANTACQPNPCQNGGVCTTQGMSFLCRCPSTYTGRCCEIRVTTTTPYNPCAQSPCRNGGRCIPAGASVLCQCPSGFYGSRCENQNYCMPNPCSNNGFCQQTTTGYICSCSYPYTGTNCQEMIATTAPATTAIATRAPCGPSCACVMTPCPMIIVVNPCMPNPCMNAGGCMVQNYGAQCFCPNYYTGYYCQFSRKGRLLISATCNKTCLNGGKCYLDEARGGIAQCSCSNEYYGQRCEFTNRPKSCSPKNPCMNNAKCIETKSGSQCVCQKGTSGILCEKIHRSNPGSYCPLDCQAGGVCVYVKTEAQCRCPKGRTGRLCHIPSGKTLLNEDDEIDVLEVTDDEQQ